jgi:hypothetical protein
MGLRKMLAAIDAATRAGELPAHDPVRWRCEYRVEKRESGIFIADEKPYEVVEGVGNLLMTAGATALWTRAIGTASTAWDATNAQLAVGNGSTAASAADTDMSIAAGSTDNTGDISAATNATPIVLTVPSWTTLPVVGEVYVVAGVNGNTAANGTFEVSAVTATTMTLLNSVGNGVFSASVGSTVKIIKKYRQLVKQAPVVSTNTLQFVSDFAAINANWQWNEFGVTLGGAATNKQATPPPTLMNRAVPGTNLGTKSGGIWTLTVTLSLA